MVWVSFRHEGPFFRAGGIALFETIILVLFLHALLAFVVPLLFTEMLLTNSAEVFLGLPRWTPSACFRGASVLPQPDSGFMAEAQQVVIGGDSGLVGEHHDNGGEPVAAPLPFPHQPLLDEGGG